MALWLEQRAHKQKLKGAVDSNFTARYHGHVSSLIVSISGFLRQNAKMVGKELL